MWLYLDYYLTMILFSRKVMIELKYDADDHNTITSLDIGTMVKAGDIHNRCMQCEFFS